MQRQNHRVKLHHLNDGFKAVFTRMFWCLSENALISVAVSVFVGGAWFCWFKCMYFFYCINWQLRLAFSAGSYSSGIVLIATIIVSYIFLYSGVDDWKHTRTVSNWPVSKNGDFKPQLLHRSIFSMIIMCACVPSINVSFLSKSTARGVFWRLVKATSFEMTNEKSLDKFAIEILHLLPRENTLHNQRMVCL